MAAIAAVEALYREPHRRYHTWDHVGSLLTQYGRSIHRIAYREAFFVAILYHDAVYDPTSIVNEKSSADLMATILANAVDPATIFAAKAMILATQRHLPPESLGDIDQASAKALMADIALFIDMDLSILAADDKAFDRYSRGIRLEYAHVPDEIFLPNRRAFMARMLERTPIFLTPDYREQFETKARDNLMRYIAMIDLVGEYNPARLASDTTSVVSP
jgi:predicted metal-dependent HD superfamily phosphohydrolase